MSEFLRQADELAKLSTGSDLYSANDISTYIPTQLPGRASSFEPSKAPVAPTQVVGSENPYLQYIPQHSQLVQDIAQTTTQGESPQLQQTPSIDYSRSLRDVIQQMRAQGDLAAPAKTPELAPRLSYNTTPIKKTSEGAIVASDGRVYYPDGTVRYGNENAQPIKSLTGGRVQYSDGSIREQQMMSYAPTYAVGSAPGGRFIDNYGDVREGTFSSFNAPKSKDEFLKQLLGPGFNVGSYGEERETGPNGTWYVPGAEKYNEGIDIGTGHLDNPYTPIYAPGPGKVVGGTESQYGNSSRVGQFGPDNGYGWGNSTYLELDDPGAPNGKRYMRMAHLGSKNLKTGDTFKQGDVLGTVGVSGNTTGPHLSLSINDGNGGQNLTSEEYLKSTQAKGGFNVKLGAKVDPSQYLSSVTQKTSLSPPQSQQKTNDNFVGMIGSALHLPELGVSEMIDSLGDAPSAIKSSFSKIGGLLPDAPASSKFTPNIGKVAGSTSISSTGSPMSPMKTGSLVDNRDTFFKAGGADMFNQYMSPGVDSKYRGSLDTSLFSSDFFKDPERVGMVFGNTSLAKDATQKYKTELSKDFPILPGGDNAKITKTVTDFYDQPSYINNWDGLFVGDEYWRDYASRNGKDVNGGDMKSYAEREKNQTTQGSRVPYTYSYEEDNPIYLQNQYNKSVLDAVPETLKSAYQFVAPVIPKIGSAVKNIFSGLVTNVSGTKQSNYDDISKLPMSMARQGGISAPISLAKYQTPPMSVYTPPKPYQSSAPQVQSKSPTPVPTPPTPQSSQKSYTPPSVPQSPSPNAKPNVIPTPAITPSIKPTSGQVQGISTQKLTAPVAKPNVIPTPAITPKPPSAVKPAVSKQPANSNIFNSLISAISKLFW